MGEHHCTVCTIVSGGWGWGGAGFDGPQVTSFLRVCQPMAGKVSGTRSEARSEADISFCSVAFTVLLGAGRDPKFLEKKL